MKKLFSLFIALTFVCSISAFAQTVSIGSESGTSPVNVPISFDLGSEDMRAFDLTIDVVNSAIVSGVSFQPGPDATFDNTPTVTYAGGQVAVSWQDVTDLKTGSGVFFYLAFTGSVGSSDLDFISENVVGQNELVDGTGQPMTATFEDGDVTFIAPVPLKNWAIFIGLGLIIAFLVVRFRRIV